MRTSDSVIREEAGDARKYYLDNIWWMTVLF